VVEAVLEIDDDGTTRQGSLNQSRRVAPQHCLFKSGEGFWRQLIPIDEAPGLRIQEDPHPRPAGGHGFCGFPSASLLLGQSGLWSHLLLTARLATAEPLLHADRLRFGSFLRPGNPGE
jgi:hypothetical protein